MEQIRGECVILSDLSVSARTDHSPAQELDSAEASSRVAKSALVVPALLAEQG
jgi:hypothetical protein